jgi:hypothetical protein
MNKDRHLYELQVQRVQYDRAKKDLERQQKLLHKKIIAAFKAGKDLTDIIKASKYTDANVRTIARANGIPPSRRGPKPKKAAD